MSQSIASAIRMAGLVGLVLVPPDEARTPPRKLPDVQLVATQEADIFRHI